MSSAIRHELRPGEWVLWKARAFRFVALRGCIASIRDSVNAELHEVSVAELRGMPSLAREDFDQCRHQQIMANPSPCGQMGAISANARKLMIAQGKFDRFPANTLIFPPFSHAPVRISKFR